LALVALVAVVVTLIHSYYTGHGQLLELESIGHINHTAIYLLISYAISLALLLFNFKNLNSYQKITLVLTTIILFFTTIDAGSKAAFGLLIIITLLDFLYLLIRVKKLSLIFGFLFITTCIGISFMQNPPDALKRIQGNEDIIGLFFKLGTSKNDIEREKIREFSYYAFKTNPIFGVGFGNFGRVEMDDIKVAALKEKKVFNDNLYISGSHAHSVYYNYLVNGGLLSFSVFIWFWFYIFWIVGKHLVLNSFSIYKNKFQEIEWIVLSGISVVLVNLGIGFVNTTLHHEHAILSMFVLGLLIAQFRKTKLIEELVG
jgi:O-antigen ligase